MKNALKMLVPGVGVAIIISAFIFGTWIRYSNLSHVGFRFDIITTQYTWGKAVAERGFSDFWKNYDDYFDYLPGALYLDTAVYIASTPFGGSEEVFALLLKSVNWVSELVFVALVFITARKMGRRSYLSSGLLAGLAYVLPSFWFVSAIWGQIDSLVVVLSLIALMLLVQQDSTTNTFYKQSSWWSGILFGLALWIKMQPVLVLPVFVLIFIIKKNRKATKNFTAGFLMSTGVLLIAPLLLNPARLGYVIGAPFFRESVVSRSAVTFWTFIGTTRQDFLNEEFHPETIYRIIALLGLSLYAVFSMGAVVLVYRPSIRAVLARIPRISDMLGTLLKKEVAVPGIFIVATISTIAYFEFMVKMYERYLHFGTMLAMLTLAMLRDRISVVLWLCGVVLLNLGNFLNLLGVYTWWGYEHPAWLIQWYISVRFNQDTVSALMTLSALVLFLFVAKRFSRDS